MLHTFKGGIHPDGMKYLTNDKPIEKLAPPPFVVLPVSMHIGAPCTPLVNKGDHVYMAQKIADSDGPVSAPVHATISGIVRDVLPYPHPNGTDVLSVIIDNDYKDELDPSVKPFDVGRMTTVEIISAIRDGGIVGHGGAAFPTHLKISSGLNKVDTVLINAAECEPYITSDHRILLERTAEVIEGAKVLKRVFGEVRTFICVESNKQNAFDVISKRLLPDDGITLFPLRTKYPQGAEKQLIYSVTKREVPSGKLPADAGCAVFNADTAGAVYRLFSEGLPDMRRVVTVSGSAICTPKNLEVRIGTPIDALINACGGFKKQPERLLMGGPMMGNALYSLDVPVIKGTNAVLALCGKETVPFKESSCIRCGKCVKACPIKLLPTYIYQRYRKGSVEDLDKLNVLDCIECGACAYVCPAKIPLVSGIRAAKQRVQDARRAKK
ncbi:MAG: electron transport complex subunit RsxC [Clostridia bacterium]|nr:electron transport complex subunit RsxC [Clostridia bacterium]